MHSTKINQQSLQQAKSTGRPLKGITLCKNDQKWENHREEIHRLYIKENKSLSEAMRIISERHGFKACERKWKMKLKEWCYQKYATASSDKKIAHPKSEQTPRDCKDINFYQLSGVENQTSPNSLERTQRIKIGNEISCGSRSAEIRIIVRDDTLDHRHDKLFHKVTSRFDSMSLDNTVLDDQRRVCPIAHVDDENCQQLDNSTAGSRNIPVFMLSTTNSSATMPLATTSNVLKRARDDEEAPSQHHGSDTPVKRTCLSPPASETIPEVFKFENSYDPTSNWQLVHNFNISALAPSQHYGYLFSGTESCPSISSTINPAQIAVVPRFCEVHESAAFESESRARAYEATNKLPYALEAYRDATVHYSRIGDESAICRTLVSVARVHGKLNQFSESVSAYRTVSAKYSAREGKNSTESLQAAIDLATALIDVGNYDESLDTFCNAMDILTTECYLSPFWQHSYRVPTYARKFLAGRGRDVLFKLQTEFIKCLEQRSLDSSILTRIVIRLRHLYPGFTQPMDNILGSLQIMETYFSQFQTQIDWISLPTAITSQLIVLANLCSGVSNFQMAEPLFSIVFSKLDSIESITFDYKMIELYLLYFKHRARCIEARVGYLGVPALKVARHLVLATSHLIEAQRSQPWHVSSAQFEEIAAVLAETILDARSYSSPEALELLKSLENLLAEVDKTQSEFLVHEKLSTSHSDSINAESPTSHQYGVTYSSGSITGVSISDYIEISISEFTEVSYDDTYDKTHDNVFPVLQDLAVGA